MGLESEKYLTIQELTPEQALEVDMQGGTLLIKGDKGEKGDTWKPTVSEDGELSWEISKEDEAPTSVNIKGPQGTQGEKGDQGLPFSIKKIYPSVEEMEADFDSENVSMGDFVIINTNNVEDEDNAKLFKKGKEQYELIVDMSGARGKQGVQGQQGLQGLQGEQGVRGLQGEKGEPGKNADLTNVFKLFPSFLWVCFGSSKQIIKFNKDFDEVQTFKAPEGATPKSISFYNGRCFYTSNKLYELDLPNLNVKNSKQILSDERGYQGVAFGKIEGKETLLIAGSSRAMGHKFFKVNPNSFEVIEEFLIEKEFISDLAIIDGFLYYALGSHIVKYDVSKKQEISRKSFDYSGRLYGITEIDKDIYISEYKNNQIHKLDRELNVIESYQVEKMPFGISGGINEITNGKKGPTGERGEIGPQGAQGLRGEQGIKGQDGKNGLDGAQGPRGLQGETGAPGPQGPQGERGLPFAIKKIYRSVSEMNQDFSGDEVSLNEFVLVNTGNTEDEDNAKLFIKSRERYEFIVDMSGARGIQGPPGPQGLQGVAGQQGQEGAIGPQGPRGEHGEKGDKGEPGENAKIWVGSDEQYQAIEPKDPNTIYLIK